MVSKMANEVAFKVRSLARVHGVFLQPKGTDRAYDLAAAVNRLEGVVGDEIVDLIGLLLRSGHITFKEAGALTAAHNNEVYGKRA